MNNSTFSKAKEILRKRINVRLINNARGYIRYGNKLRFVSQKISSKNFVAIYEVKPVLTLDKSIQLGFSILDLSELLMYELHYKYIKRKYNVNLLFTDTGS